jgi:hypothetical protein
MKVFSTWVFPKSRLIPAHHLLNAAKWDNTPKADDWFEKVPFVGAFGTEDWTEGWAEWNAHLVRYFCSYSIFRCLNILINNLRTVLW